MKTAQSRLRLRLTVLSILAVLTLLLPAAALAAPASAPAESVNQHGDGCATQHVVRRGETLSSIARSYGVSVNSLMQANNIRDPNRIFVGQRLCIPGGGGGGHPGGSCANVHTVRYGETLSGIAAMYGVSTWAIMEANGISKPNRIFAGQRLCIPGGWSPQPEPEPQPPSGCFAWHSVQRGETLSRIAGWYGTTVAVLMRLNGITNPNHIYTGQSIKVPVSCDPNWPWQPEPQPPPRPQPCPPDPCGQPCKPQPCPKPEPQPTGQWNAEYWANPNLEGAPVGSAVVGPQLSFNWGRGGPGFGVGADNWSARFSQVVWLDGGTYRFNVTSDDGVRVFVTGRSVIDGWRVQAPTNYTGEVQVATGNHEIRVDYFQAGGEASLWLEYSRVR